MHAPKSRTPKNEPSGALARALAEARARARRAADSADDADGDAPANSSPRGREGSAPERILGDLLAPLGSVELAHRLAELASPPERAPDQSGDARQAHAESAPGEPGADPGVRERARTLDERTRSRLDELKASAAEPLRAPFEGRGRLATPEAFHSRLEELCAAPEGEQGPSPADIAEAARDLAGPFHERVGTAVRRARGLVQGVRLRLREEIRALGSAAAELEELDTLLADHTATKTQALFDRVPAILAEHFESDLADAARAAPAPPPRAYTEGFFAEGGWVSAHIARCRDAVLGVFEHERRAVCGLLTAVREAAGAPPAEPTDEISTEPKT